MKCPKCNFVNKPNAKFCVKCGYELLLKEKIWVPDAKWYIKTIIIIYVVLIILFVVASILLKPYVRNIVENW
jgi:uncharacterized OB-fold protein